MSTSRLSLKSAFGLTGEEPAREAVRAMVDRMLLVAREQEAGILDDIDAEYLHDYRIAIRKIRAVLTQLRGVFPPGEPDAIVADLRAAARATNHLRDLDVRLLAHDAYQDLLPERLRDGLEEMFADVAQERAAEHRRIAGRLRSAAYRRRMARTQAFFSLADALPESKHARTPIRAIAGRRILSRHRRVVNLSRTLTVHSPDAALHELRIQCKKLRYLLELFAELYDPATMARLVKRLRRLQNRLGSFHDCAVQLASLQRYWDQAALTHPESLSLALSLGGLMGALHREQLRHRQRALNALSSIRDGTAKALFKRTFRT
jgi:CHAD domain-containing protein